MSRGQRENLFKEGCVLEYKELISKINGMCDRFDFLSVNSLGANAVGRDIPMICVGNGERSLICLARGTELSSILLLFADDWCRAVRSKEVVYGHSPEYLCEKRSLIIVPDMFLDIEREEFMGNFRNLLKYGERVTAFIDIVSSNDRKSTLKYCVSEKRAALKKETQIFAKRLSLESGYALSEAKSLSEGDKVLYRCCEEQSIKAVRAEISVHKKTFGRSMYRAYMSMRRLLFAAPVLA